MPGTDDLSAVGAVVADVGRDAERLDIGGWLDALRRAAAERDRLGQPTRAGLATQAARAASEGIPLPLLVDTWLTSGWVLWNQLAGGVPTPDVRKVAGALLRALDDGAQALAEGYVREQRNAVRRNEAARAALLDGLLGEGSPDAVIAAAGRLGVDLMGSQAVLVVDGVSEAVLERLRDAGALAAPREGQVVAVLRGPAPRGPEPAGLGRPAVGVDGIRASYGQARRALSVALRLGLQGVVPYDEVLPEILIGHDRSALEDLVETTLGGLRGARHGAGPLLETLEAYFAAGLAVAATARDLGIHERTVRYRLARIAELTGLDLDDPHDRFRVELALRGRRLIPTD